MEAVKNDRYSDDEEKGKVETKQKYYNLQTTQKYIFANAHIIQHLYLYLLSRGFLEKEFLVQTCPQVHSSFTWAYIDWDWEKVFVCLLVCCLFDVLHRPKNEKWLSRLLPRCDTTVIPTLNIRRTGRTSSTPSIWTMMKTWSHSVASTSKSNILMRLSN